MTERRIYNCLLLHVHKDVTDSLESIAIATELFVPMMIVRSIYFGHFNIITLTMNKFLCT